MQIRRTVKLAGAGFLAVGALSGAVVGYAVSQAPGDAGVGEAVRVALDPGAAYALLRVEGMT
ncbi:MAG: hypothetical protein ACODAE_09355 [Gemmatimonadota bacterium]